MDWIIPEGTLTIPKTKLQTIVRDTLRGVGRRRTLIGPGLLARGAVLAACLAPALSRAVGKRQVAAVRLAGNHRPVPDGRFG
jgi:hypothetical protein